jgi:hypothetical protein
MLFCSFCLLLTHSPNAPAKLHGLWLKRRDLGQSMRFKGQVDKKFPLGFPKTPLFKGWEYENLLLTFSYKS